MKPLPRLGLMVAACLGLGFPAPGRAGAAPAPAAPAATVAPAPLPPAEEAPDPPPAASDAIARKIIENYVTVTGGAEALRQVRMIQFTGVLTALGANGGQAQFTLWIAPPERVRFDSVAQLPYGKTLQHVEVVNGNAAWTYEPTAERPTVKDTPANQSPFAELAPFGRDFLDADAKGIRFKYEGKEKFRGMEALVVKTWLPGEPKPQHWYFDPQKFLLLRIRTEERMGSQTTSGNIFFTRYENKAGLWLPTEFEMALGDTVVMTASVNDIRQLPAADPALFARPAVRETVLRQQTAPAAAPAPPAASAPAAK